MAGELGLAEDRIGIMGLAAGGFVTVSTLFGPPEGRPDFAAPMYAPFGKRWNQSMEVPEDAPPLFIATAANDQVIPWTNSADLFSAWMDAGYPAELHIFQIGRHAFMEKGGGGDNFMDRLEEWLNVNG